MVSCISLDLLVRAFCLSVGKCKHRDSLQHADIIARQISSAASTVAQKQNSGVSVGLRHVFTSITALSSRVLEETRTRAESILVAAALKLIGDTLALGDSKEARCVKKLIRGLPDGNPKNIFRNAMGFR